MEEDIFNTELGNKVMALTKASFKVSDLIPDLILRDKIKTQILNVYKNFFEKKYSDLLKEIDVLDGFFFLAGQLNFVKDNHLRVLRNGFLIFKSRIVLLINESSKTSIDSTPARTTVQSTRANHLNGSGGAVIKKGVIGQETKLNERQKKIMKYFQEKDAAKLSDLLVLFSDISEKTVRNDLNNLIKSGKINREGSTGIRSFYKVIRK